MDPRWLRGWASGLTRPLISLARRSLLVIPGADEFSIYADVEFSGARAGNGTVKVESRRADTCPAP